MRTEKYVIVMFHSDLFYNWLQSRWSVFDTNREGREPYYGGVRIIEIEITTILVSLGPNELSEI